MAKNDFQRSVVRSGDKPNKSIESSLNKCFQMSVMDDPNGDER